MVFQGEKRPKRLIYYSNTVWPQYRLDNRSQWPENGTLDYNTPQSVQFSSVAQSCLTLCDHSMPGLPVHHQLLESTQTHVHCVGDVIQPSHPCHPLLLRPSIFPSIRVFSNGSALRIRWPKYWSFSFNISPSNEHPGLLSFRMDWLDPLAVQGTLNSLLQHHSLYQLYVESREITQMYRQCRNIVTYVENKLMVTKQGKEVGRIGDWD